MGNALSFTERHLDPATRMGEILFGLIMTLTFTLGAGLIISEEGREGARQLLIATIGCNLAWGIIDGALYVLSELFERKRRQRVASNVANAGSDLEARAFVADELDEVLAPVTDEPERAALYDSIARRLKVEKPAATGVRRSDLMGALVAGWLVFACSFPAAIPFMLIDDPMRALRVSNAILLALLFIVGYRAGRHTQSNAWLSGLVFLLIGLALVVAAIALGG
jgi:VIT1/CCC1 family predicted Fe2+/Mn2+ transporter